MSVPILRLRQNTTPVLSYHKAEHKAKEALGDRCGTTQSTADIREHMDVIGSCGKKLGKVDHLRGSHIKLKKRTARMGCAMLSP